MYANLGPADDTEETVSRTFAARLKITINICNIAAMMCARFELGKTQYTTYELHCGVSFRIEGR